MKNFIIFCVLLALITPPAAIAETADAVKLPILMYHRLLKTNPEGDVYTITPAAFEADMKYLADNGYTAVTSAQILLYLTKGAPALPEKPVYITFDDGHFGTLCYGVPILEKYNMCASVFVVGEYTEADEGAHNPRYSLIRWDEMEKLPACLEIQSHTWGMHKYAKGRNGIGKKPRESQAEYRMALASDLLKLQAKAAAHAGRAPIAFAHPFGVRSDDAPAVFNAVGLPLSVGSEAGINVLVPGGERHELKRLCRTPGNSAAELISRYA